MKCAPLVVLAFVALGAASAQAQETLTTDPSLPTTRVGTRGATFLNIGVGARAQALAGAYAGIADDVSALYWNSAGIALIDGFSAGISSASLFEGSDISHLFVGAVIPVGFTRLGFSLNTLNSGEMPWTNENFPNGGFIEADGAEGDIDPERTPFEYTSMAIGGHIARPITDRLVVGGAVKYITDGISSAQATFVGVDVGTIFRTGLYGVTIGATLQNLGSSGRVEGDALRRRNRTSTSETQFEDFIRDVDTDFATQRVNLPTQFRFNIATELLGGADALISPNPDTNLRVLFDLSDAVDADLQTALGAELSFRELAFLRAGKRWVNEAQIEHDFAHGASFGAGVSLPIGSIGRIGLDYAYTGMGDLENIQVWSLQAKF